MPSGFHKMRGISFGFLNPEDGTAGRPETSVRNYHYSLRNDPEGRSSQLFRG